MSYEMDSYDMSRISKAMLHAFAIEVGVKDSAEYSVEDFPGIDGLTVDEWDLESHNKLTFYGELRPSDAPGLPWVPNAEQVIRFRHSSYPSRRKFEIDTDVYCDDEGNLPEGVPWTDWQQEKLLTDAVSLAMEKAWQAGLEYAEMLEDAWNVEAAFQQALEQQAELNKWSAPTINGRGVVDGSYLEEIEQRVAHANEEINERLKYVRNHPAAGDEYAEIIRDVLANEGLMFVEDYNSQL